MQAGGEAVNNKRIPKQFLGAFKKGHRFAARQFIDEDLAHKLLEDALSGDMEALRALEFMTKFNNEYYKKVFKKDGSDFFEGEARLARQNEIYAMQMDVLIRQTDSLPIDRPPVFAEEETLVALIDLKNEMEKAKKQ